MKKLNRSAALTVACLACLSHVAAQDMDAIEKPAEAPATEDFVGIDEALSLPSEEEQAMQPEAPEEMDDSINQELDQGGVERIGVEEEDLVKADEGAQQGAPTSQKTRGIQFRVTVRPTYDDNIFISEKNPQSDLITSIAPGIIFTLGDAGKKDASFIAFNYSANAYFFLDHSDQNSVDQNAAIRGQWAGAKLTLAGFVEFHDLTETNNETSDRVNRKAYETGLSATYAYSDKTTFGTEIGAQISNYANQLDTRQTEWRFFGDYAETVLTKIGLGLTLGQVDVQQGTTQTFEQLLARVTYAAGSKLDLSLKVGGELRQVENGSSTIKPVFSMQAIWSPYELLKVRVDGYRRVQPSIIDAGANTVVTGVGVNVSYRILSRFDLSLTGAYERSSYESVIEASSISREDDYLLGRIGVSYPLTENIQLGASYQFRTNASTENGRSFDNNQISLEASISY